jgi:hypothetical protein
MEVYQVRVRPEFVEILKKLAAREGCSVDSMIELLLEEKLSELKQMNQE